MTSRRRAIPTALACLAALAAPCAQGADSNTDTDRRVLIDRELNAREITLLSITEEAIAYLDEQGRTRQASVGGIVALLPLDRPWGAAPDDGSSIFLPPDEIGPDPDGDDDNPAAPGVLELADGQRFPGEHAPTGGDEDAIIWAHPVFGRIAIDLDRVARAVLNESGPVRNQTQRSENDEIILANGDRLTGFILSMGDPIEIEVDHDTITIPAERVASVRLANDPRPMQGLVVWLDDGSVVVVATIDGREGEPIELSLPTGQSGVFAPESIDAVAFRAGMLQGLASIAPSLQTPLGERFEGDPARVLDDPIYDTSSRLTAPDIEIPGPMRIQWPLPTGARRFATIAEMPFDAIPWGDCILRVEIDGAERARQRINADNPRFEINIPIEPGAGEISVSVEPGAWGPINDRVTLRRPLLLLENNPS